MNKEIRQAVSTGKVILGADKSIKALKLGRAKLVILSSTCQKAVKDDIEHYAKLANVPIYRYPGDGAELGLACGKPFFVNVMVILEPGNSNILNIGVA